MPDAEPHEPAGESNEILRRLRESNYNQKPLFEDDEDDEREKPNMSPEPANIPTPENQQGFPRSFSEIQDELKDLIEHPNPQREGQLKIERARLIRAAQDQDVFGTLKRAIADIQLNNSPNQALQKTDAINVAELENFESGVHGWNEAYRGMLDEYREVAVLNMELAMRRARAHEGMAQPEDQQEIDRLRREIDIRGWGLPPQGLEANARRFLRDRAERQARQQPQPQQPQRGERQREDVLERVFGTPERRRREFTHLEEIGMKVEIPPLQSNIWEGLTENERLHWQARLKLSNGRANIQAAFKPEDVFPSEVMTLSKEELNILTDNPDGARAFVIYLALSRARNADVLCQNISPRLQTKIAERQAQIQEVQEHNSHIKRKLIGKSEKPREVPKEIKTFCDIDDDKTLKEFREDVIEYFIFTLGMSGDEAVASEHIAFNLIRNLFVQENSDNQPKTKYSLSQIASGTVRNLMYPEANLVDFLGKNRVWPPNIVGTFAKHNKDKYMRKGGPDDTVVMFGKERLMPEKLLLSPLEKMQKADEGKTIEVRTSDGTSVGISDLIKDQIEGEDVDLLTLANQITGINWDNLDENPFQGYYLGQVNNVILVNAVLTTADLPNGKGYGDLENALNILKLNDKKFRRLLIYIIENKKQNWIKPNGDRFEPTKGTMAMRGFWTGFNRDHPTFFNTQ